MTLTQMEEIANREYRTHGKWEAVLYKRVPEVKIGGRYSWKADINESVYNCDDEEDCCGELQREWNNDARFLAMAANKFETLLKIAKHAKSLKDRTFDLLLEELENE